MCPALRVVPALFLLAACTTQERREPPPQIAPPLEEPAEAPEQQAKPEPAKPLARRGGRHLAPIPTRPLNVSADCKFKDEVGTSGHLQLDVSGAEVLRFDAAVKIPRRGVCRFALAEFTQAERLPNVRLAAHDGACSVRIWEQPPRVTVAFSNCAAKCSGEAFDYLWPILVDTKLGQCH